LVNRATKGAKTAFDGIKTPVGADPGTQGPAAGLPTLPFNGPSAGAAGIGFAARKQAALELIGSHERVLRRTARRYSICADDAEDAYQRALEILLRKAPTTDPRELIRWMQTVTKHEALAVRRNRERILGRPTAAQIDAEDSDWVQLIPSEKDGPADEAERRERIGRSREALQALKPQELRALTLLAEGYSYSEISQITGWTYTNALAVTEPFARSPFLTLFFPCSAPA
jgi:RNA polymerase sigma factor (sigma-70 family)